MDHNPNTAAANQATSRMKNAHSSMRYALTARSPEPSAMRTRYGHSLLFKISLVSRKKALRIRGID